MSYKLKQDSIGAFSSKASAKICDDFYSSHRRMNGGALLKLTESKQVNAFLVKALFEKWQVETTQLKSPYFDFDNKKVQEALRTFMNVLSDHISVAREDLEPLLIQAVEETVLITFDPVGYVERILAAGESLEKKYIKTRKSSFKNLSRLSAVSIDDFDDDPPISPQDFVKNFGTDIDDLFEEESLSFFERLDEPEEEEQVIAETPIEEESIEEVIDHVEEEIAEASTPEPEPAPGSDTEAETLNDRFNGNGKVQTLADKLKAGKSKSLESSLNLNEKFMFVNALFGGDKDKLSEALADMDEAENLEEAKVKAYKYSEEWDMESEEVMSFFEVIERRFS